MPKPPTNPLPNLAVEFDPDWDHLSLAELQQLDAVCDRFVAALTRNPQARIESFVAGLAEPQKKRVVRELVQLEVERRYALGQRPTPEEYALRFPEWADEFRMLVAHSLQDQEKQQASAARSADTIGQNRALDIDTWSAESPGSRPPGAEQTAESRMSWDAESVASSLGRLSVELPADGMLGQYQLQSVLGRGGMGVVVRALDTKLRREVAIKILAPEFFRQANARERFLREARAAAGVRHDHAVTIYAVEEINGVPLLVMELVDGITLEEYLRTSGRLPASEVVGLAYQMAQGLAAAHKHGLIHRDVKPGNILLEKHDRRDSRRLSQWHAKIADFGLARALAEVELTNSGLIAGTPQYMSPEQAEGKDLDFRSDLFSLGSVMYAMCAGRAAFAAESAVGILRLVVDKPPCSLRDISPETPGWLIAIVEKLMAKSPDDRFQSAAEVAELLGRHVHELQMEPSTTDFAATANAAMNVATPAILPTHRRQRVVIRTALTLVGITIAAIGIAAFIERSNSKSEISDFKSQMTNSSSTPPAAPLTTPSSSWHGWPMDATDPAIAPFDAKQAGIHQHAWAKHLGVPMAFTNSIGMKFVLIPPGEFTMGGSPTEIEKSLITLAGLGAGAQHWQEFIRSEGPQHKVILTQPFYLGVHEVSQANYQQVMGQNPTSAALTDAVVGGDTANHPVVMVSWNDAAEFCAKLSQQEQLEPHYLRNGETITALDGTGYRFPSEAEWEFACRAGTTTKFWSGDQDADLLQAGWFARNSDGHTHAVGGAKANPFGLFDMHGNAWEWVQDGWTATSYGQLPEKPAINPSIPFTDKPRRAVRGGFSNDDANICRSATRAPDAPAAHHNHIGFRVSLPVEAVRRMKHQKPG